MRGLGGRSWWRRHSIYWSSTCSSDINTCTNYHSNTWMYSPVQQRLMAVIGSEQIKVTVAGSAVDSVGEWLKVQSSKCPTLGFESWRFELELNLMQYRMI